MPDREMENIEPVEERKDFDQASEPEQIARFQKIRQLLKNSKFLDFLQNAYKYADQFTIAGEKKEKVGAIFGQANNAAKLIESALDYYLVTKQHQAGAATPEAADQGYSDLSNSVGSFGHGFANEQNDQLEVNKLVNAFAWAVNAYAKGSEKIGRGPTAISEDEIADMKQDLEFILKHVNAYRK